MIGCQVHDLQGPEESARHCFEDGFATKNINQPPPPGVFGLHVRETSSSKGPLPAL